MACIIDDKKVNEYRYAYLLNISCEPEILRSQILQALPASSLKLCSTPGPVRPIWSQNTWVISILVGAAESFASAFGVVRE